MKKILIIACITFFIGSCAQIGNKAKNIKNTILEKIDNITVSKNETSTEIKENKNIEGESLADKEPIISKRLEEVYIRTMTYWNIDFRSLQEIRAGAACISWSTIDEDFLTNGRFEALGYSKNMVTESGATESALQSCERLRLEHRLEQRCECQIVLINDKNQIANTK